MVTTNPGDEFQTDIDAVRRIAIAPSLLEVICRTSGMGFVAIKTSATKYLLQQSGEFFNLSTTELTIPVKTVWALVCIFPPKLQKHMEVIYP
jgi:hypothetical protein